MQSTKSLKLGILALLFVALVIFSGCGGGGGGTAPPIDDILPEPEVTHYEDVTGSDGIATFTLENNRIVSVKVIDVVTGESITNIDSYLITDGIDAAFLFVDPAGIYIPRIAPEEQSLESLARNSEGRIVGTIKELWKMGVAEFSGYQPKFSDQIENRLASYIFNVFFMFCYQTPLSELQFSLKGFLQDLTSDLTYKTAICALTKIVAVHSVPVVGQVLAIVGAIELGNTAAYELWVRYYKSRGYSLDQMFEIWRLKDIIAGLTVIPFVFPIEEPSYPPPEENPGSISGKVLNAQTAEGIYYAQIQIVDLDRSTGTSSDGSYSFNGIPPGTYGIVATKLGYYPSVQVNTTVISEATTTDVNLVLSSILTSTDEYRIILTWGENPGDLDSHLWIPNGEHCCWYNKSVSGANLDVDDISSYGPETITITDISSGTYTYAVNHYSGTGKITTSGAKVEVYNDSGKIRTYEVNPNASCGEAGWYWTVFELDGSSGTITTINTFSSSSPRSINGKELLFEKK